MTPRFRNSTAHNSDGRWRAAWAGCAAIAAGVLAGCGTAQDPALAEFSRWHDDARAQAQAGALRWSDFYKESFDRLTALPPSMQQDTRLVNTVLLLSHAQKFEEAELTAQQFAQEREHVESALQSRLR